MIDIDANALLAVTGGQAQAALSEPMVMNDQHSKLLYNVLPSDALSGHGDTRRKRLSDGTQMDCGSAGGRPICVVFPAAK